jgi:GNAT superfamily N-acetyltransferase
LDKVDTDAVLIRKATLTDATVLAELVTYLGYPAGPTALARRLSAVTGDADVVLVAVVDAGVVGWVHVGLHTTLATDNAAELRGLAVHEQWQRQGIGTQLMRAAEAWARQRDCRTMYVRSRTSRRGAHAFYGHLGYRQIKTSFTFLRTLNDKQDSSEPSEP